MLFARRVSRTMSRTLGAPAAAGGRLASKRCSVHHSVVFVKTPHKRGNAIRIGAVRAKNRWISSGRVAAKRTNCQAIPAAKRMTAGGNNITVIFEHTEKIVEETATVQKKNSANLRRRGETPLRAQKKKINPGMVRKAASVNGIVQMI